MADLTHWRPTYSHRGCRRTSKVTIPTEIAARCELFRFRVIRAKHKKSRRLPSAIRYYGCKYCSKFHLTSKSLDEFWGTSKKRVG